MSKQASIIVEGEVTEALGNSMFRVTLDNDHVVIAHLSGKIRMHSIQILPGDKVLMEMSPYDLEKARITRRLGGKPKIT
jgi:translation initiation factor IF-1